VGREAIRTVPSYDLDHLRGCCQAEGSARSRPSDQRDAVEEAAKEFKQHPPVEANRRATTIASIATSPLARIGCLLWGGRIAETERWGSLKFCSSRLAIGSCEEAGTLNALNDGRRIEKREARLRGHVKSGHLFAAT
jgi:hypothetical protein